MYCTSYCLLPCCYPLPTLLVIDLPKDLPKNDGCVLCLSFAHCWELPQYLEINDAAREEAAQSVKRASAELCYFSPVRTLHRLIYVTAGQHHMIQGWTTLHENDVKLVSGVTKFLTNNMDDSDSSDDSNSSDDDSDEEDIQQRSTTNCPLLAD